ncbi:MAG: hypothetical protein JRG91_01700 [Deltaproteobacteria bacterium]|nr:hypothetical protein [Deltaproteobacteria bacterium]
MGRSNVDRAVDRARLLFNTGLVLDASAWGLAGWMCVMGVALIAVKVAGVLTWIQPWHVLVTSVPVLVGAGVVALRRRYGRDDAAAWLDLKGECGGAVIAGSDSNAPRVAPAVRPLPLLRRLVLPAVLLAASLVVPWIPRSGAAVSTVAIEHRARVVDERIERARKLDVLDEKETMELRESLKKAQANAAASPEAAVEAMDQVQKKLSEKILAAAERRREALEAAHDLHDLKGGDAGEALAKAAQNMPSRHELPPELRKALEEMRQQGGPEGAAGQMDPKALESLGKMLENAHALELQNIGKASELLADAEAKGVLEALAGDCGCKGDGDPGASAALGNIPGQGGITRGPGDAPLSFGDESDGSSVKFNPVMLEPGKKFVPGALAGTKTVVGGTTPPEEFQPGGRVDVELASEGGSTAGTSLGPYHSDVVSKYFEKEK